VVNKTGGQDTSDRRP